MNEKWETEFFEWKDEIEAKFNNLSQKNTELEKKLDFMESEFKCTPKSFSIWVKKCKQNKEQIADLRKINDARFVDIVVPLTHRLVMVYRVLQDDYKFKVDKLPENELKKHYEELLEKLDFKSIHNDPIVKECREKFKEMEKQVEKKEIIEVYEGEYEEVIDKITGVTNYLKKVSMCEFCNGVGFFEKEGYKTVDCVHCEGTGLVIDSGKKEECLLKKPHASAVSVERKLIEKCQCPIHKDLGGEKDVNEVNETGGATPTRNVELDTSVRLSDDSNLPESNLSGLKCPICLEKYRKDEIEFECPYCKSEIYVEELFKPKEKLPEPNYETLKIWHQDLKKVYITLRIENGTLKKQLDKAKSELKKELYELYLKDKEQYYFKKITHPFTELNNMVHLGIGKVVATREDLKELLEMYHEGYGSDRPAVVEFLERIKEVWGV